MRIQVQAAGVSFATSSVVQGKYQRKPPLPFVPGTEIAGVVTATGPAARRFRPGDRVCAVLDWGGLAEVACPREVNVYPIPDTLEFCRAISFTNSYATSSAALTWPHLLAVQPDQWLLVHGAAGGVGLAAVEVGKIRRHRRRDRGRPDKLAIARPRRRPPDRLSARRFRVRVLELTAGRASMPSTTRSAARFCASLRCLAPGRIMPVGFASGPSRTSPPICSWSRTWSSAAPIGLYFG